MNLYENSCNGTRAMFLKKFLLLFISIAIFLIFSEILANLFFKENTGEKHNLVLYNENTKEAIQSKTFLEDDLLLWRLRPSQAFTKKYPHDRFSGIYEINSFGLRGDNFTLEKKNNAFRLICLGDSITFGWRVDCKDAYPKKLETILKTNFPEKDIEVINAGVVGYSSLQGLRFLKRDILRFNPDILIVYFGVNDGDNADYFSDKYLSIKSSNTISADSFLSRFKSYRFLKHILLNLIGKRRHYKEENYGGFRVSSQDYRLNIEDFVSLANNKNIPIIIIVPILYENGFVDKNPRYDITRSLSIRTTGKNVKYINLLPAFKKFRRQKALFFDNSHPTEEGHDIIAREIFKTLTEERLINN